MSYEKKRLSRYNAMFRGYPDALTPEQMREMLGIGRRKAYGLLRSGDIPSVRMGRLYRIPKVAVIDFLCDEEDREKTEKGLEKDARPR